VSRDETKRREKCSGDIGGAGKECNKINIQLSCSGLGGRAEERAGGEEEDGVCDDDDGGGGSDDDGVNGVDSCDILPGLIQKALLFASPFHSHTYTDRQRCHFIRTNVSNVL